MEVRELIEKSPVRVFEESINGGLGRGNLGVLASRHGVGKTACLVHLAVDKLLRGENIVHVSFGSSVEYIMGWYKEVFREITEFKGLDDTFQAYESLRTNRVMLNFSQENVSMDKIIKSIKTLINEGAFKADAIFFDGYKLSSCASDDICKIKQFAKETNLEVWFSVSPLLSDTKISEYGIPESMNAYTNMIDVLVGLHYNDAKSRVIMTIVQDHNKSLPRPAGVSLDPKTMLIAE